MTREQEQALLSPFDARYIQWKIQSANKEGTRGLAVAYLNRTAIEDRLDSVFGRTSWATAISAVALSNGDAVHICSLKIRDSETGEWIEKANAAGNTNYEPVKGGASDAFKRAAAAWGIGRYLRDFNSVWVDIKDKRIVESELKRLDGIYEKFLKSGTSTTSRQQSSGASATSKTGNQKTGRDASRNEWTVKKLIAQNGNMALTLLNETSGEIQSCLVIGEPELKEGQKLNNVEFALTERKGKKLRLLGNYSVAA